jgi:hypothetical protein
MKRLDFDTFIPIPWRSQKDEDIEKWLLDFVGHEDLFYVGNSFGLWSRTEIHRGCQPKEGRVFRFLYEEDAVAFRIKWF